MESLSPPSADGWKSSSGLLIKRLNAPPPPWVRQRRRGRAWRDAVVPNVWTQPESFRQGGPVYGVGIKWEQKPETLPSPVSAVQRQFFGSEAIRVISS